MLDAARQNRIGGSTYDAELQAVIAAGEQCSFLSTQAHCPLTTLPFSAAPPTLAHGMYAQTYIPHAHVAAEGKAEGYFTASVGVYASRLAGVYALTTVPAEGER